MEPTQLENQANKVQNKPEWKPPVSNTLEIVSRNLKSKGYSILPLNIYAEIDEIADNDIMFNVIAMVKTKVLNSSYSLKDIDVIPDPITKDRRFLELPGFYLIKNDESIKIYKLLSSGIWKEVSLE